MGDVVQLRDLREPWVTTAEVAGYLSVSGKTVIRFAERGMPSRKVGGQWRFRLSAVDAWIDQHQGVA